MKSNWKSPSFSGVLPVERNIDSNGFTAKWEVSNLIRNYPQVLDIDKDVYYDFKRDLIFFHHIIIFWTMLPEIQLVNNGFAIVPDMTSKSFSTFPNLNLFTLTKALVSDKPIDRYPIISFLSGKSFVEKYPVNFILAV